MFTFWIKWGKEAGWKTRFKIKLMQKFVLFTLVLCFCFFIVVSGYCMWFPTKAWQICLSPGPETHLPLQFWACLERRLIIVCCILTRSEQILAGNPQNHFFLHSWKILLSIKSFRTKYTKEGIVKHSSEWIRMLSRSTVVYFGSISTNIWVYT